MVGMGLATATGLSVHSGIVATGNTKKLKSWTFESQGEPRCETPTHAHTWIRLNIFYPGTPNFRLQCGFRSSSTLFQLP